MTAMFGDKLLGTLGVRKNSVRSACSKLSFQRTLTELPSHLSESQFQISHNMHVQTLLKAQDI